MALDSQMQAITDHFRAVEDGFISVGNTVLMEYAQGVVETVVVDAIEDGMVYGTGDDGEPFCAPLANCDKVPF